VNSTFDSRREAGTSIERFEWILLALNAAARKKLSPVQLQKILFLLGDRRPNSVGSHFYRFRPYHYGPFDAEVYHDADTLAAKKLLLLDEAKGRSWRAYSLTDAGIKKAKEAEKRAPKKTVVYLRSLVNWAEPLPFESLVRAIYDAYPKMRVNSIFRAAATGED
jgi:hypothetical protein